MNNNSLKKYVVSDMSLMVHQLRLKYEILDALDRDTTEDNSYELHDQLATISNHINKLNEVLQRSTLIIPEESDHD